MMKKIIHKKGFSLIELSVVIIVIATLVAGVAAGDHLIKSSRIAAARSITLSSQIVTISGMVAWYETTTRESFLVGEAIDENQITTWYNREPSNFRERNNLSTSASVNVTYEEKSINNLPAVSFISGKMALSTFSGGAIAQPTVVVVFRPSIAVTSSSQVLVDSGGASNPALSLSIKSDSASLWAPTESALTSSFVIATPYIVLATFNGTSSSIYMNNTTALSGSLNPGTNSMDGVTIGSNRSGASFFTGDIAEIIVFNRNLKESERYDVFSYLSKKYKISVTGL